MLCETKSSLKYNNKMVIYDSVWNLRRTVGSPSRSSWGSRAARRGSSASWTRTGTDSSLNRSLTNYFFLCFFDLLSILGIQRSLQKSKQGSDWGGVQEVWSNRKRQAKFPWVPWHDEQTNLQFKGAKTGKWTKSTRGREPAQELSKSISQMCQIQHLSKHCAFTSFI